MNEDYRERVLRLVVEEAIQKDKDKGMIIDNPSGYFNYKMERARHQAKEDPSWLMRQKDRLLGVTQTPLGMRTCHRCGAPLAPSVALEYDGHDYCDLDCAEGRGVRMSLKEWMIGLRRDGERKCTRRDDDGNEIEFVITYAEAARTNPKVAAEIEREHDEF